MKKKVTLSVEIEVSTLTQQDCYQLIDWGHTPDDIPQIDRGVRECVYKEYNPEKYGDYREHRISRKKAIDVLGREKFLSGISRAAFHMSCERSYGKPQEPEGEMPHVCFDLSKWWR